MNSLFSRPWLAALVVAIVGYIVYQFTIAPAVDFIDAGELATVCTTLGIAHPTGYPLFTIVGWIFAHLPIASSVIMRLNEMAALFTALGAGSLTLLAFEIFHYWLPERVRRVPPRNGRKRDKTKDAGAGRSTNAVPSGTNNVAGSVAAALVTGFAAAFSITWWSQSTAIEVYPLHLFLVPLVLLMFLRMLRSEEGVHVGRDGRWFALLLGLSFSNHMTTVLMAPAALYAFFARYGFNASAWKKILKLAPFFLGGLALYLYLPLRSASYPLMDWGHPTTFALFNKHVTGGQYSIWMFQGDAAQQWTYFWHRAPIEFTYVGALVALAGIYSMVLSAARERVKMLIVTLLLFFGCLFYAINYSIHDIDSYFLLAFLTIAIWIGAGTIAIAKKIAGVNLVTVIAAFAIAIAVVEIGSNFAEADESGNHMVEDYTKNMLRNLPQHAIIFSTQWDFWLSGAFYYQLVERLRPDILVIDKAMLRDRPWYYEHLRKRAPDVMQRVQPEMNAFLEYLRAFDLGQGETNGIAQSYEAFTEALVERNLDRPIFVTQEMLDDRDDLFAPKMKPVPAGVAYRLLARDSNILTNVPTLQWQDASYRKREYLPDNSRLLQAAPLARYAQSALGRGDTATAIAFFDAALRFTPDLSANLDALPERDRSFAEMTNERFSQIQNIRNTLRKRP